MGYKNERSEKKQWGPVCSKKMRLLQPSYERFRVQELLLDPQLEVFLLSVLLKPVSLSHTEKLNVIFVLTEMFVEAIEI